MSDAVDEYIDPEPPTRPGAKPPHNWRSRCFTAAELQHQSFPPIRWAIPDLVPEGLTLLCGRPKCGKSWMALDWILGISGDRAVMDGIKPAMAGDALYLALEDNRRRLQDRITKLAGAYKQAWPARLTMATEWPRLDKGGLDELADWCRSVERPSLIVLDTLQKVRPIRQNNGYAEDYDALTKLQELAGKYRVAIVVVHHTRKMDADDPFDTVSGTLGLTGSADTILVIQGTPQGKTLHGRGRDLEAFERAVDFSKETWRWRVLGDAKATQRSAVGTKILEALEVASGPLSPADIAGTTGIRADTVKHRLGTLVTNGDARKHGRGRYVHRSYAPPVTIVTSVTSGAA